jgi:hypothetical protein
MAKIRQNVLDMIDAVLKEGDNPTPNSTLIADLRKAATEAILSGHENSEAWDSYMTIFADNPEQLQRLKLADAFQDVDYVRKSTAYLAGGSICTSETMAHLAARIDEKIDNDLNDAPDEEFITKKNGNEKIVKIPKPPVG